VPSSFQQLGYTRFGALPVSVFLLAAVVVLVYVVLCFTRFGYHIYAVGGDEDVSKLSGLRTHRVIIGAHVLCSMAAATTGLFLISRLAKGTPTVGSDGGYDLESIAAVVLGGTALMGGRGGVLGTVGGVFILAVLDNTFNQLEVNSFLKDVVRGLIIIAAVAVYARRQGRTA
jgi:ribose transport system permease protein